MSTSLPEITRGQLPQSSELVACRDRLVAASGEFRAIDNQATMDSAASVLREITSAANDIEKHRKAMAKPYADAASFIKEAADTIVAPLLAEKERLKRVMGEFAAAEARRAEEARRKAEQEARDRAEQAAAEHAAAAEAGLVEADAEIVVPPPAVPATIIEAPRASGAKIGTRFVWNITDPDKVDHHLFMVVDPAKVNAYLRMNKERIEAAIKAAGGKPVEFTPGITFTSETTVSSTGR